MNYRPAIVVVGYNRPDSLERVLSSVAKAIYTQNEIPLVISLDYCEDNSVLEVAKSFDWKFGEKIVRTFKERQGLKKHILQCGDLTEKYGAVIILEDDLVVAPSFYQYVVEALEYYQDVSDNFAGIGLYSHKWNGLAQRQFTPINNGADAFFGKFFITWGQCWRHKEWVEFREWLKINDGKLNYKPYIPREIIDWPETSWGKYFASFLTENEKYYVVPYVSQSTCFAEKGFHTAYETAVYQVPLSQGTKKYTFKKLEDSIKYDMFFECENLLDYLKHNYDTSKMLIDLYGTKDDYMDKRFLVSTANLPHTILRTYGLKMRPQELNIYYNTSGTEIKIYDLNTVDNKILNSSSSIFKYEIFGIHWKKLLGVALSLIADSIKFHLDKFKK